MVPGNSPGREAKPKGEASEDHQGWRTITQGLKHFVGASITEEPDAVMPHVRIFMGAAWVTGRPAIAK